MEKIVVVSPPFASDPAIVITACGAGELGIFDLGYRLDKETLPDDLAVLHQYSDCQEKWGIRWDAMGQAHRSPDVLGDLIREPVSTLVLAGVMRRDVSKALEQGRTVAGRVLLEVCSLEDAEIAQNAGYDGLIVKGHEAGGYVSNKSSFILLQEFHGKLDIPYWIQGGMGLHTAAAACLAGTAGIVLCEQLWLAEDSGFGAKERKTWEQFDGSETTCLSHGQLHFRCWSRLGAGKVRELESFAGTDTQWQEALHQRLDDPKDHDIKPCGQDIGLAPSLAEEFGTVKGILAAFRESVSTLPRSSRRNQPLSPDSSLAAIHGTRYPLAQGPMARVSDSVPFAKAVAAAGGLPFFGLSLLREMEIHTLLSEAHNEMGSFPWGVGLLGFIDRGLFQEQRNVVNEFRPPFAIIAGGRPSQAAPFEAFGTSVYLHVPSPSLLSSFMKEGARKFILEGCECGGHVGPLTDFILWESAVNRIVNSGIEDPWNLQLLFAGGIHNSLSAAIVQTIAAPLVALGVNIGALMGTAYLFTDEALQLGAITPEYQNQVRECKTTVLLKSGAGHASRCVDTPFVNRFYERKRQLIAEGKPDAEIAKELELLNMGRLRIAAKGASRIGGESAPAGHEKLTHVDAQTQRSQGMFMVGQVAELRKETFSIADLHGEVSAGSIEYLQAADPEEKGATFAVTSNEDIAIVGIACKFPEAGNLKEFWHNIMNRTYAIREVSKDRWNPADFFEADRMAFEKTYSKWGGFLKDADFDPVKFGIPPRSLNFIEPTQLLALETAWQALEDAGYHQRDFPRERTSVIFGAGGVNDLGIAYGCRASLGHYISQVEGIPEDVREHILDSVQRQLPGWSEDTFPGILASMVAGRIANRLNLGGSNFTVEASCASSLAALDISVKQLQSHACDVALTGAVDVATNPFTYILFSRTQALSPTGKSRPLDDSADGIVLSEGVAALVLKRLKDAERDGDYIYALIKGIGSSSDGRTRSVTAPHAAGQSRALRRAHRDAGIDPHDLQLVELHGTGTVVGDETEINSLLDAFGEQHGERQYCAIGSVKSMIGHTKVAAGMAGLIKTALALNQKILPPTLGVQKPNAKVDFARTPFCINTESRPWFSPKSGKPRRAGVSAFGFGGTNFHVVLEEYSATNDDSAELGLLPREAEIVSFSGAHRQDIRDKITALLQTLTKSEDVPIAQIAYSLFLDQQQHPHEIGRRDCRLSIVASSMEDLLHKLTLALKLADAPSTAFAKNPLGVYYGEDTFPDKAVCFLFPGQGSQRTNMLRDLILGMLDGHSLIEMADKTLAGCYERPLSRYIYPIPVFSEEERRSQQEALNESHVAQPAMSLVDLVASDILTSYGIQPDFLAGHSFGEYVALSAAGVISRQDLMRLSEVRGRILQGALADHRESMAGVQASPEMPPAAMRETGNAFAEALADVELLSPRARIFNNATAEPFPSSPEEIRNVLVHPMCEPVLFERMIRGIYDEGARVFVEAGPGSVLTDLVERILCDQPHHTLAIDAPQCSGWMQLAHVLAHAHALGIPVSLGQWFQRRRLDNAGVAEVVKKADPQSNPDALIWKVNGSGAVPCYETHDKTPADQSKQPSPATCPEKPSTGSFQTESTHILPPLEQTADSSAKRHAMGKETDEAASSLFEQLQGTLSQFLKVQHEQQKTMQRFIDVLEKTLGTALQRGPVTGVNEKLVRSLSHLLEESVRSDSQESQPVFVSQGVPPTPILPKLPTHPATPALAKAAPSGDIPGQIPASPPSPAAGTAVTIHDAIPSTSEFKATLLHIISERTGFPPDMLEDNLSLEADLGVDSIKKVEVLSKLRDQYDWMRHQDEEQLIEELAALDSLESIVQWYEAKREVFRNHDTPQSAAPVMPSTVPEPSLNNPPHQETAIFEMPAPQSTPGVPGSPPFTDPVRRWVLKPTVHSIDEGAQETRLSPHHTVLLVGEQTDFSACLEQEFSALGHPVLRIETGKETKSIGDNCYEVDISSLKSIRELPPLIRERNGKVCAIVNLMGLGKVFRHAATGGAEAFFEDEGLEDAKHLFLLLRAFEDGLKESAQSGGAWFVNISALDGQFGLKKQSSFAVGQGGTVGLTKALAREWPYLKVKCIDIDPHADLQKLMHSIRQELQAFDGLTEVGLDGTSRWKIELEEENGEPPVPAPTEIDGQSVLLVTGGGYGVVSLITRELAARYQPRIIIVGRSPYPREEPSETKDLESAKELREFLIQEMRRKDPTTTPVAIEDRLQKILQSREIRKNLQLMKAAGATVEYKSLDVRDAEGFAALIENVYETWNRIDGVIHGAGVIEDKLIKDKTPEAFARVFDTKVTPAMVLAKKLRPEELKFLIFFSSVVARFGNVGQTDYSAANEVLNKLAHRLDAQWEDVQVTSINWGPWDSGMMPAGLKKLASEKGINPIPADEGVKMFFDELSRNGRGESEVVITSSLNQIASRSIGQIFQ
jgi:acyl transferase domain-containing protein/NAD(P)H-dependent flavin oxidoreductase YrpB (nitropropane dioxygenase family)/NAD(P)-dependent dehydrogenase (short-subunit alcohol dehydrogenase family)/acyl carrier protein